MRSVALLCPLLLVACAPRAILLVDAGQSGSAATAATHSTQQESQPIEAPAAAPGDDEIGLLEPRTLARMPEERDMRPTVDPEEERPVIANPPTSE